MLLAIVAIWTVGIPAAALAISWGAPDRPRARAAETADSLSTGAVATVARACAHPACRLTRTTVRRACPELGADARRRPASA